MDAPTREPVLITAAKRVMLALLHIAGYTWFKTYCTIEQLGQGPPGSESSRTVKWLEHKQSELNFASLIGGLLASAVTASLSWPDIPTSHWLVRASWYSSLSMVITSVIVAFQQVAVLGGILATHTSHSELYRRLLNSKSKPDWKTVIVLQVPIQLLSYSIFLFTLGLAIHVVYPLSKGWGDNAKIAVFYVLMLAISVGLFLVGSNHALQLLEMPEGLEEQGKVGLARSLTVGDDNGDNVEGSTNPECKASVISSCQCSGREAGWRSDR